MMEFTNDYNCRLRACNVILLHLKEVISGNMAPNSTYNIAQ